MIRLRNLAPEDRARLNVRPYPSRPEYVLLDPPGTTPSGYFRGTSDAYLEIPEAEAWQRFLAECYLPPSERRLLLLQPCSWAKPYDMSATLQPLAELCRRYPFVHRVVMSNVGLVPAELQMNPLFCAYDWAPPQGEDLDEVRRRYTLRTDGFMSVHAPYEGGEWITKPLIFTGKKLILNLATSAGGQIRVEVQDANGAPIEGFKLDQSKPLIGDAIERAAAWAGGNDVSALAGKPVRLRFEMSDADVFSLRFR